MYKISVPVISDNVDLFGRERILKELKRLGATRVFLAISQYTTDEKVYGSYIAQTIKEQI